MYNVHDDDWLNHISDTFGYDVSDDRELVGVILEGLNKCKGHCPCVSPTAHNQNTICPCAGMQKKGHCHCGLFKEMGAK